jgi:receptor protein-tyrosine kinase
VETDRSQLAAEVRGLLRLLRDQWWIVLLCLLVAGAVAAAYLTTRDTKWEAQSALLLVQDDPNVAIAPVGSQFIDPVRQRATDLELVTSPAVGSRVARRLNRKPRQPLPGTVQTSASGDSNIIRITAKSDKPLEAIGLANAFAVEYINFRRDSARARYSRALNDVQSRLSRLGSVPGSSAEVARLKAQARQLALLRSLKLGDAELVQRAAGALELKRDRVRTIILALLFGLLLGLGLAVLRDRLDDRIKSDADLEAALPGVPFLESVPLKRNSKRSRAAMANSFHNIRVAVSSLNSGAPSVVVTSAMPNDGKSTTALNLAGALGDESRPAMLVDADLRRPRITEMLSVPKGNGVANILGGKGDLESAITPHRIQPPQNGWRRRSGKGPLPVVSGFVAIVPAGRTSAAPQRLFTEEAAVRMLEQAREFGRPVIIDGPPLGQFSDMIPLARRADAVVVAARLYHTRARALRQLARQLQQAGITPLGVVLLGTRDEQEPYYGA